MPGTQPPISLLEFSRLVHPIGKAAMEYVLKHATERTVNRGRYLIKPGQVGDYYFVKKGLFRSFVLLEKKELTTWICAESCFITPINSLQSGHPAQEYIQALEDSQLLCLNRDLVAYLYKRFSSANVFARKLLERYYADAEQRALISRMPGAQQRWNFFLEIYPELSTRVPLKYIASFLGIRLETLSRIRRQKPRNV